MSKPKQRREGAALFESVARMAARTSIAPEGPETNKDLRGGHADAPVSDDVLAASRELSPLLDASGRRDLPKMKKFRFQLLHEWLVTHVAPCRVADVGGGKGLLAYLLGQAGWPATVIDPADQSLPTKYKDLLSDRQIRIAPTERVARIDGEFEPGMARDFDLLVAMHAHGCMVKLIEAAAEHGRDLVLLPCCVIQEPIVPERGVHWIQCLVDRARAGGLTIEPFRLNFKGQNIGLYARAGGIASGRRPVEPWNHGGHGGTDRTEGTEDTRTAAAG